MATIGVAGLLPSTSEEGGGWSNATNRRPITRTTNALLYQRESSRRSAGSMRRRALGCSANRSNVNGPSFCHDQLGYSSQCRIEKALLPGAINPLRAFCSPIDFAADHDCCSGPDISAGFSGFHCRDPPPDSFPNLMPATFRHVPDKLVHLCLATESLEYLLKNHAHSFSQLVQCLGAFSSLSPQHPIRRNVAGETVEAKRTYVTAIPIETNAGISPVRAERVRVVRVGKMCRTS